MDRMSLLPDDVISKLLTFLPIQDAVSTSLLSKRWYSLWKYIPKLTYHASLSTEPHEYWRASRFVDKFLLLHKAPVLEALHLELNRHCPDSDIETWTRIAVSRGVRVFHIKLIRIHPGALLLRVPSVLFTCETLVKLTLVPFSIVDDVNVRLPSLKNLGFVGFSSDDLVRRFLSGCPVLESLGVVRCSNDNVKTFTIDVPSLLVLIIIDSKSGSNVPGDDAGFVIKTPSLKSLIIHNQCSWRYSLVDMPYLKRANIKLRQVDSTNFMECLISTKHASLCLQPSMEDSRPMGIFNQLVSLNICTCSLDWCHLILSHAPKLRALIFELKRLTGRKNSIIIKRCCTNPINVQAQWEQPSSVPECLMSSLETVEWIDYKGTQAEKNILMYLLENSRLLKKMEISSLESASYKEKFNMLQEIWSTPLF